MSGSGLRVEKHLLGRSVGQGLVGPLGVEVVDVAGNDSPGFADVLEPMKPGALFLERTDEPFAQAVLLGGIGRDVFLLQAVVLDQGAITPGTEHEPIIVPQQRESCRCAVGPAEPMDQGFFQGAFRILGPGRSIQTPAQDLAGAAVQDGDERAPAIHPAFHQGDVRGPTLVGLRSDGLRPRHPRALAHGTLAAGFHPFRLLIACPTSEGDGYLLLVQCRDIP